MSENDFPFGGARLLGGLPSDLEVAHRNGRHIVEAVRAHIKEVGSTERVSAWFDAGRLSVIVANQAVEVAFQLNEKAAYTIDIGPIIAEASVVADALRFGVGTVSEVAAFQARFAARLATVSGTITAYSLAPEIGSRESQRLDALEERVRQLESERK